MGYNSDLHNDRTNKIEKDLQIDLKENIELFEYLFKDCGDIIKKRFLIAEDEGVWGYVSYVDSMTNLAILDETILEMIIKHINNIPKNISKKANLFDLIANCVITTADIKYGYTFDEACLAVLSGDTVLFVDGFDKCLLISSKGWPSRGIQEPDTEGVVRGSRDAFSEGLRVNTVLIRRRIRDTKLKIRQDQIGTRSRTDIAIIYMEDLVKDSLLKEIEEKLHSFSIDAILEGGMLEELMIRDWKSPFPKMQVTQRPDKAAAALLEGRVAIVVDNSPFVLLLPTTINCFYSATEDYYQDWYFSSFIRFLRYFSGFMAVSIPAIYIALTCYNPAMIPVNLTQSIAAARLGVPFPTIIEVLLMELEFELLREAGVRLPGSLGSTISIVGGLIIGQAAVAANIVSPIIVVIVSGTAIASFTIPTYTLVNAYRVVKYWLIFTSSFFGLFGFWIGFIVLLTHLTSLKSFNYPYLMPFVSGDINDYNDIKDSIFRLPLFIYKKRSIFTKQGARVKLNIKNNNS